MPGTIPNIALIPQFDNQGQIASGCELRLYTAGSLDPAVAFKDVALTTGQEHPWPIVGNSSGRLPTFYLDDGNYRVMLTTSGQGELLVDDLIVPTVGQVTSGGGDTPISSQALHQTGDWIFHPGKAARDGWVRLNGRTIGNASSGATERGNADASGLFAVYYALFSDTVCPVSGGRGASAAADFAANKTLTLPDLRGKGPVGFADMGAGTSALLNGALFTVGNNITIGSSGGAATHTLTEAQIPVLEHFLTDEGHAHDYDKPNANSTTAGAAGSFNFSGTTFTPAATSVAATGLEISNHGSGQAHNNMSPFFLGSWYGKL